MDSTTDPTAHAIRHLDVAEDTYDTNARNLGTEVHVLANVLLGVGWALVGIANELAAVRREVAETRGLILMGKAGK